MADTFTLFPKLPTELRLKIWESSLPEYFRTIHLRKYKSHSLSCPIRPHSYCMATTPCPSIVVALLETCHESRFAVTRRFQSMLKLRTLTSRTNRLNTPVPRKIPFDRLHYFDAKRDGVFVDSIWPWTGTINKPTGLFNTRTLNIHCNDWWSTWNKSGGQGILLGKDGLLRFRHLEKLNIVHRVMNKLEMEGRFANSRARIGEAETEIAWPSYGVQIDRDFIEVRLQALKAGNPEWKVPEVKCVYWAAGSPPKAEE